ncbi:MAG TPA: rRNA cytosine-C5-methylase, partial [Stellaceae bacterium]|nr:rRNA cytosine-C5-methylase [Stellaceae bacterium]
MTPGARIAAAIDILAAIGGGERPADDTAADYFRRRRYIGAKDRVQVASIVYAVLRHRAVIDWWIARASKGEVRPSARSRAIAALLLIPACPSPAGGGAWTAQDIAASFDGGRFRPAALSPAESRLARGLAGRTLTHPEMPRAVACDIPDWLEPYLAALYGRRLEDEMAALHQPAPFDLRVNALKADRETARRALAAEHIEAEPTPWSPLGLRLKRRSPLAATAAFRDGLIEVQDEGSQLAALLADARPGMRVVDFCAGAGGKTLALAAQMQNRGR